MRVIPAIGAALLASSATAQSGPTDIGPDLTPSFTNFPSSVGLLGRDYSPEAQPDRERFYTLLQTNDSDQILPFLFAQAEAGETWAMMQLGAFYASGSYVEADAERSLNWFATAARAGDDRAALILGLAYSRGDILVVDDAKAAGWLSQALESEEFGIRRDAAKLLASLD